MSEAIFLLSIPILPDEPPSTGKSRCKEWMGPTEHGIQPVPWDQQRYDYSASGPSSQDVGSLAVGASFKSYDHGGAQLGSWGKLDATSADAHKSFAELRPALHLLTGTIRSPLFDRQKVTPLCMSVSLQAEKWNVTNPYMCIPPDLISCPRLGSTGLLQN